MADGPAKSARGTHQHRFGESIQLHWDSQLHYYQLKANSLLRINAKLRTPNLVQSYDIHSFLELIG